jgi:hypothetical protein
MAVLKGLFKILKVFLVAGMIFMIIVGAVWLLTKEDSEG